MYYVYVIHSDKLDKYYTGYTHDIKNRVNEHNSDCSDFSRFTKSASDWKLQYIEKYNDKTSAIKRERQIKNWHSRALIQKLINDAG